MIIDPYAYQHLDKRSIKVLNNVADHIVNTYDYENFPELVNALLECFRVGMDARALAQHVTRRLKL